MKRKRVAALAASLFLSASFATAQIVPGGGAPAAPQNVPYVIASSGTPVTIYGNGSSHTLASITIPANTVAPDSDLELEVFLSFFAPNNGGRNISIKIGTNVIGQSAPTATNLGLQAKALWYVTSDLTAGNDTTNGYTQNNLFGYAVNLNDVLSPTANQAGVFYGVHTSGRNGYKVDFTQSQTLTMVAAPVSGDQMEVTGWRLVNHRVKLTPTGSYAPSTAWAAWGDSLTYGVGSSSTVSGSTGPYPQQIAFSARVGVPYVNMGVSGDKCADITGRLISDKVRGKYWNVVLDEGRNDIGSGTLTATVLACQQQAVANLASSAKYVIGTIIPAANEGVGSANWNSIVASNAQTNTSWGTHVADVFSALTSAGTVQINNNPRAITVSTTNSIAVTSGTSTMTVTSPTGIVNGMFVDDATGFIPPQTTVTISGSVVTLSNPTTGTIPITTAINFVGASEVHMRDAGYAIWASTITTAMTANGF